MTTTTQKIYKFDNITIIKTRFEDRAGIFKNLDVSINRGKYFEVLHPGDIEYKKAIIKMINQDNLRRNNANTNRQRSQKDAS